MIYSKQEIINFYNKLYSNFSGRYIYLVLLFRPEHAKKSFNVESKKVKWCIPQGNFPKFIVRQDFYQLKDAESFYEKIEEFTNTEGVYDDDHTKIDEGFVIYSTAYSFSLEDLKDYSENFIETMDFSENFKQLSSDFYREFLIKKYDESEYEDIDIDIEDIDDHPYNFSLIPQGIRSLSTILRTRSGYHVIYKKIDKELVVPFYLKFFIKGLFTSYIFSMCYCPVPGTLQAGVPVKLIF